MRSSVSKLSVQSFLYFSRKNLTSSSISMAENRPISINNHIFQSSIDFCQRGFCQNISKTCWKCNKSSKNGEMFCDSCGILQDLPEDLDYFRVFNFSQTFSVKNQDLTKKFRQLQSYVHPDKFSNKDSREQVNSSEWSSYINKAYKTLLVPIDRGLYILKLNGYTIPEDNSTLDKEFLMEMMERNEEIEDANSRSDLDRLLEKINKDLIEQEEDLDKHFSNGNYELAKLSLVKMKYFKSLENSLKLKAEHFMSSI